MTDPAQRSGAKETDERTDLERLVEGTAPGVLSQAWELIRKEKKWYLLPLLLAFLLIGGFIVLGGSGAAPLLYTLF
jgi:hypothetical protein